MRATLGGLHGSLLRASLRPLPPALSLASVPALVQIPERPAPHSSPLLPAFVFLAREDPPAPPGINHPDIDWYSAARAHLQNANNEFLFTHPRLRPPPPPPPNPPPPTSTGPV